MHLSLLFHVLCLAVIQQDAPPPPPTVPTAATSAPTWMDVDGAALVKGALPGSTTAEARQAFELVRLAPRIKLAEPFAVTGFDLRVDLRYRGADGQRNDLPEAQWQWLAPDCLRLSTGRKRELVRGPQGDWLIDASREPLETLELGVAREHRQDKRALDEGVALARTVQTLFDLSQLRVRRFELAEAPTCPNEALTTRARELVWVVVETPDLQTPAAEGRAAPTMVRALLGWDKTTGLVEQAQLAELKQAQGTAAPTQGPVMAHLSLRDHRLVDGILVPHQFALFNTNAEGKLRGEAAIDGYLRTATLKPQLARESFVPPTVKKN